MLLGATACSDDHFDIKQQPGAQGGVATIWESIEANPELSDAAEILKATRVMKDDKDNKATLMYSEWLNQGNQITVWLPKNGHFEKETYLNMLAQADSLEAAGDKAQALRLEYQVGNQFVCNHIALFNYAGNAGRQQVRLLNSKLSYMDASKSEFNGIKYDPAASTHNSNGVLYVLEAQSPFAYNIYDFMSSDAKFSTVFEVISNPAIDKNVFWPEGSTEGAMNEKGEIVYVDSVFRNSNEILNRAQALIKSEDSVYVAMIPTNEAWDESYKVVEPLFHYGKFYNYDWDEDDFENKGEKNGLKFNTDSLQSLQTSAAIIESMFFNPTNFSGVDVHDSAQVIDYMLYADSLISTNGVVYYNENAGTNLPNPLFEGLTPIKASNGFVFAPTNNRIKPEYSFMPRIETRPGFIVASLAACLTERGEQVNLTVENWQKDLVKGSVEDDWYHYFPMEEKSTSRIRLKVPNLPCGHYKVYAQMLPNKINKYNVQYDGETPIEEEPQFNAKMLDDNLKTIGKEHKNITFSQDSVSNVVLFEDFHLEKSFKGLPSGYETFCILEFNMSSKQKRDGKCHALSISKIVIEPIRK